jgi:type I restriction enzyme M protein
MARSAKVKTEVTTAQRLSSVVKSARDVMRKDKGLSGDLDRLPMLTWIMFLKFLDDMERAREQESSLAGVAYQPIIEPPYRWRDWASSEIGITGDELIAFVNQEEAVLPGGGKGPGLFAYLRALQSHNGRDRRDVVATVFRGVVNRMINGYLLRDVVHLVDGIHFTGSNEIHTLSLLYESMLKEMRDAAGDSGEFYTPRPVVRFMVEATHPRLGETILDPACGTGGFLAEAYQHLEKECRTVEDRATLQERSLFGGEAKPLPFLLGQMNLVLHGLEYPQIAYGNSLGVPLREIGDKDRVDVILTNPPFGGEEEAGILSNFPDDLRTSETALLFLQLIMRKLKRPAANSERGGRAAVIVPNTTLFYPGVTARIRRALVEEFGLWAVVRMPKGVFEPYTDIETNILFLERGLHTESVLFYRLDPPGGRRQYTKTQPLRFEEMGECMTVLGKRQDVSSSAWLVEISHILADEKCSLDLHNPKAIRTTGEDPIAVVTKLLSMTEEVTQGLREGHVTLERLVQALQDQEGWREIRLGNVLRRRKDAVEIEDDTLYKRLRIQVKGRGVVLRDERTGRQIGTKRQFLVQAGQFLLSKIDARNGAFGIAPEEGDGAIITGNFWAYDVDASVIDPRLLQFLTRSDAFLSFCAEASPGATNRRYLQEELFLDQRMRLPNDMGQQRELCDTLMAIDRIAAASERNLRDLAKRAPVLLQASLHRLFGGKPRDLEDEPELEPPMPSEED